MTLPSPAPYAPLRTLTLALAAAALWMAAAPGAEAQVFPGTARDTTPTQALPVSPQSPQGPARPSGTDTASSLSARGPLLDAPISRTEYQLGPGDRLEIAVFGELNRLYAVAVSPEGSLVIPGVGIVNVLGINLVQAEQRVRQAAARYFRNVDVRLTLSAVRSFKVFVVGDVASPGVRTATAATRVSEVVAGSIASGSGAARGRNITLRRSGGDSVRVDLIRFQQMGDVSANPTVREGDAVIVPTQDERVYVYGRVRYAGIYEYRQGETLADLLMVANGGAGFPADAAENVRVVRFTDAQARTEMSLTREEAMGAAGRGLVLRPFDGVYVASVANFMEQQTAQVTGQVQRPGVYPIRPDTTTVRELVEMAGGFTPLASVVDATLRRQPPQRSRDELSTIPPELLSTQDLRVVQVRGTADVTNVVIDFAQLFTEGTYAYAQTLRSGDLVNVPVRRAEVQVLGAVRNPGMIAYNAGQDVRQYLAAAGGLSRRADLRHAVVLRARTGGRLQLREAGAVEPGDAVIVPFKEERSKLETLQFVTAIASTVSGVILAAIAILRS